MARIRTRGALLTRLDNEAGIDVGNRYTAPQKRRNLASAWAWVWLRLTAPRLGYGTLAATLTATPDQSFVDLPADFLDLRQLLRSGGLAGLRREPIYTSREAFQRHFPEDSGTTPGLPGYYWIEGPDATDISQRIELRPVPSTAEELDITYVIQEPSLGDPDNGPEDATVSIDVIDEDLEAAIIGIARVRTMARDDMQALGRAQQEAGRAIAGLANSRGRRQAGQPNFIDRYQGDRWGY